MKVATERCWAIVCPEHGLLTFHPKQKRAVAQQFVKFAKGRRVVRCTITYPLPKRRAVTVAGSREKSP